jgi:hypothetical protein
MTTHFDDDPEALRVRHHMTTTLGLPFPLVWSERGGYLAQWVAAEKEGRKISVREAAKAIGVTPP